MLDSYDIDYSVVREILINANQIYKKNTARSSSKAHPLDLITILQSYSKVLRTRNIDSSKDTIYYQFLLDLSVENNKLREPDWFSCFEKLQRRYERKRLAYSQYHRRLLFRALSGLYRYTSLSKQDRSHDFSRLSIIQKHSNRSASFVKDISQDQIRTLKRFVNPNDVLGSRSSRVLDTSQTHGRVAPKTSTQKPDVSERDYSPTRELSFVEDLPEREGMYTMNEHSFTLQDKSTSFLRPLDLNLMNQSMERPPQQPVRTPYLGKIEFNNEDIRQKENNLTVNSDCRSKPTGGTFKTGGFESGSTLRRRTKESETDVDRLVEELMGKDKQIESIQRAIMKKEEEYDKEEALKVMNQVFFKWSNYVNKKKGKRQRKEDNVRNLVNAMEYNYQTILTKGFIALGFNAINKRKARDAFGVIKGNHEREIMKNAFSQYKFAYETHALKRLRKEKAGKFYEKKLLKKQLLTWRGTVKQRIKSVKGFQSVWQPKVLIILLGSIYKVDLNRAYQDVLAKLAHKLYSPPSREGRLMEAISLLNEDLMKKAFAFWKVYKQKCLDSRTYHEQRSKQKIFVFWKHYSKKREQIRTNLALSKLNKNARIKDKILAKWSQFAKSRAKVNILAQQLVKKINIKLKTKYYNHWSQTYEHLTYTREADQLSSGHYREKLLEKVFRGLNFTVHREMTQKMNKSRAVEHRDRRKLNRFFVKWHGYAAKRKILKEKEAELKKERRIQALEGCLQEWIFAYESTVKIENFRSKHLKIGLFEALQRIERYNNRIIARVQEFYNRREGTVEIRLLRRCFGKLKLAMNLRRRKEEYMEDSTERLARKFFKRWRREYLRAEQIEGNLLQTMDLQRYKVLSGVFEGWAGHVMKRKGERLLGEELRRRTEKKTMKKWYKQWRGALTEVREEKYCEEIFMQAHGKDLLRRGFEGLREKMEKANNDRVKVKKIHRKKLLSVAFRTLKERVVRRREKRENRISKEEVTNYYNTILLGQCLLTWKIETQKKVQKRRLVEKFRERRDVELKGFLFKALEWNRANQKNIRGVQEMYSKRTLAGRFAMWREEFLVSVAGREMREMKEQRVMRACFDEMRSAGRENKKMKMLKILEEKYGDRRVLEDAFEDWRDMIRYQGGDFREWREVNLLRKALRGLKGQRARREYKEEMGILIEQRNLMRVFRAFKRVTDQQRRLREQEEQMIIYARWKRLQKGFKGLKKGYNEVKELMGAASDMIHRRSDRLLVKGFTFWKYYTIRKRENEVIIAEFQARRLERTVGSRLLRMPENYVRDYIAEENELEIEDIDMLSLMRGCFNGWAKYVELRKIKHYEEQKAREFYEISLGKKALFGLVVRKTKGELRRYQESVANHYYTKTIFKKFLRGVFVRLEKRHGKIQAIRHYAQTLMVKSMLYWKRYTKRRFSSRYKKIMETQTSSHRSVAFETTQNMSKHMEGIMSERHKPEYADQP